MKCGICNKRKCKCGAMITYKQLYPTIKENKNYLKETLEPVVNTVNKLSEVFWMFGEYEE